MKKIVIINDHLSVGGTQQYISSLSNMLVDNYDIDLVVGYKFNDLPSYFIDSKSKIFYLVEKPYNQDMIDRFRRRKKYFKYLESLIWKLKIMMIKTYREIRAIKHIDSEYVVTTKVFDAFLVSLFCRRKTKKIAVDFYYPTKIHEIMLHLVTRKYKKIIVLNDEVKSIYKKRFKGKVFTISNFINTDVSYISDLNNKNIISIGKLSKNKGFFDLLDIMKILVDRDPEIKLFLIGDGKESRAIKAKIKELNLVDNVVLTGFLNQFEIESYMLKSSVYAMCTKNENYGMNLLEAMNYGLPTFAFDSALSAQKLLKDGSGVLVANRNIDEYADRLYKILHNKKMRDFYSERSLEKVQNFSITKAKYAWINILEELSYSK